MLSPMVVDRTIDDTERALLRDQIDAQAPQAFELVRTAVQLPSFSDTGEGIAESAAFFESLLGRICPDARTVPTEGNPVVLGTVRSAVPGAPTLIIYGLYDVTPTMAEEWSVDPLEAVIIQASEIGLRPQLGELLVGRGVNNHKGPVVSAICAVEALLTVTGNTPVNLIFVIEGEEEVGSPSLPAFVEQHRELLQTADGVWLPCMQQNPNGVMTVRRGFKGCLWAQLSCAGGDWGGPADARHVWAGNSAWIDAPMMQLIRALGTMYDDNQRVTIDGLESLALATQAELMDEVSEVVAQFRQHPEWGEDILASLNARQGLGGKDIADHLASYMTASAINIQGVSGGYQGPTFYSLLPGRARAYVDFRFPPGIEPEEFGRLVRAHLDRRGFPHISLENMRGYAGAPAMPDHHDPLIDAGISTAHRHAVGSAVWPMANNCCPAALFTALGRQIPFSVAGLGHGDRAHAPDEYITTDSVPKLMHFTADYLYAIAEAFADPPVAR